MKHSILGDSRLERDTKPPGCASVRAVMIMKRSGPFIPGFVHYSGPSPRALRPIPPFPVVGTRQELIPGRSGRSSPPSDSDCGAGTRTNVQVVAKIGCDELRWRFLAF